jgi:glycerophosphoryl diester phosphodiesterase
VRTWATLGLGLLTSIAPASPPATLEQIAVLPAETFAGGPPAGKFEDRGEYGRALPAPRFTAQPVQGISSIKPARQRNAWWALSDNGFGSKWNSLDYRSCIYLFQIDPTGTGHANVRLKRRIELQDPKRRFPHPLIEARHPARPFTGGDIDPESMVAMPDGSFWIGDEFGPWLLHFSERGQLLAPPVELRIDNRVQRSVHHPEVLAQRATATIRASRGLEGLALQRVGSRGLLYAMLEGALTNESDPRDLQILEFDPVQRTWTGRHWRYALESTLHSIGEIAAWNADDMLVIERDGNAGERAAFKRIFAITLGETPEGGRVTKQLVVDLLRIADPRRLASKGVFRFPFQTIESIHALPNGRLVLVNDNNFPAGGGRTAERPDPTEWIWLKLPQ